MAQDGWSVPQDSLPRCQEDRLALYLGGNGLQSGPNAKLGGLRHIRREKTAKKGEIPVGQVTIMVSKSNINSITNEIMELINPAKTQDEVIWPKPVSFSTT